MLASLHVAVVTLALTPSPAWAVPEGCPDLGAVLDGASALGADVEHARYGIEGTIEPAGAVFRLELDVWTPSGTTSRTLYADSCDELAAAASLVLSVAIDPLATSQPSEPSEEEPLPSEPAPPREVNTVAVPAARPASETVPDETRNPGAEASALVAGAVGRGLSPSLDGRLQLGVGLDVGRLRVEAMGFHAFAQDVEYASLRGVGAKVGAWGGVVRAGPRVHVRGVSFACPVGVEIAGVVGSGFGAVETWSRSALAWSVVAAPGASIRMAERVRFGFDLELAAAVRRPAFVVDSRDGLYRIPRLGVRGGVRLEVRFSGSRRDQNALKRRPT